MKKSKVGLSFGAVEAPCVSCTVLARVFPAASVGRQRSRELQPRVTNTFVRICALCGMRSRNCGQDTRRACAVDRNGRPRFLLPRGEQCGVQHEMSLRSLLGIRHACYGHWKPAAGHAFSSAEPDLRLASRNILFPYCCAGGWQF